MTTPHRTLLQHLEALEKVTQFAEAQICMHEETHRGGVLWEICSQCGAKWADDEGGKPEFKWPKETDDAHAAITALREALAAPPAAPIPDGMVMVPREPTEEMIQAAAGAWGESESGLHNAFAAALRGGIAAAPAAPVVPDLKHCACEFDGDTCVTQCKLHAAHVDAIHEWAERAKAAEANMLAAPVVPLTDEQIRSMWKSSEFRGNGGQVDWFCEGIRAAEAHHGITGGKP